MAGAPISLFSLPVLVGVARKHAVYCGRDIACQGCLLERKFTKRPVQTDEDSAGANSAPSPLTREDLRGGRCNPCSAAEIARYRLLLGGYSLKAF